MSESCPGCRYGPNPAPFKALVSVDPTKLCDVHLNRLYLFLRIAELQQQSVGQVYLCKPDPAPC